MNTEVPIVATGSARNSTTNGYAARAAALLAFFVTFAILRRMPQRLRRRSLTTVALGNRRLAAAKDNGSVNSLTSSADVEFVRGGSKEALRRLGVAETVLLSVTLYVSNIIANVLNKQVLIEIPNRPLSCTALLFGVGTFITLASWATFMQRPKLVNIRMLVWQVAPVSILQALNIIFTQVAVARMNLSLFHTIKAAEPLWTALFSLLLLKSVPTRQILASLIVILMGVVLASSEELTFSWSGFMLATASNLVFVLKNVLAKQLLQTSNLDDLNLLSILTISSFAMSLPLALWREGASVHSGIGANVAPGCFSRILAAGAMFQLYQVVSIHILSHATPITHSVVNSLKRPMLVIASVAFFGTPIGWRNGVGIIFALMGVQWYGKVPHV